jgi:anti-sigma-K factor RskA
MFRLELREGAMYDENLDALAAEYVLGTLAADERAHADALLLIDTGFVEIVHQWERRLGELNVMVEAVEPPLEIWDKIRLEVSALARSEEVRLVPAETGPQPAKTETPARTEGLGSEESPLLAALASTLMQPEAEGQPEQKPSVETPVRPSLPIAAPKLERNAEVFYLAHRVQRWRFMALVTGALAAMLALFIMVSQVEPSLIPPGGFRIPQLFAQAPAPAPVQGNQLVAVLQQDPTTPAFLMTVDAASRTLTVRRMTAEAGAGHSYELWLTPPGSPKPLALGVVGGAEFTQRPLSSDFDLETMRAATYAVSFEPAGGSPTGAPTGPILFSGKLVESVPASPKT